MRFGPPTKMLWNLNNMNATDKDNQCNSDSNTTYQTPIWIWPVTTSCPMTNPHTSQSTQNIPTNLPFGPTAYPAVPVVKCQQHATWPRRQTDIFFPWSLVLKLVSHVLLSDPIQFRFHHHPLSSSHHISLLCSIPSKSSLIPPVSLPLWKTTHWWDKSNTTSTHYHLSWCVIVSNIPISHEVITNIQCCTILKGTPIN